MVWSGYRNQTAQDAVQNELSQIHSGVDKLLLGSNRPAPAASFSTVRIFCSIDRPSSDSLRPVYGLGFPVPMLKKWIDRIGF